MLKPNDKYFVQLISRLAQPPELPDAFTASADTDILRTEILKALRRLPSTDVDKFFAVLNAEAPPHETNTGFLARAHKAAKDLLPHVLRKYQSLLDAAARETSHQRFVKDESAFDPFLEDANLSRDAYAGRGEVEPDTPLKLDRFGNCVRD